MLRYSEASASVGKRRRSFASTLRMTVACDALEPRRLLAATLDAKGVLSVVGIALRTSRIRGAINATSKDFSDASVKSISIDLGDGADKLIIASGVGAIYCLGGLGDDTIFGGDGNDSITSGGGKDVVHGGA